MILPFLFCLLWIFFLLYFFFSASFLDEPTPHSTEVMPEQFLVPEIAQRFINELLVVQSVGRFFFLLYK